MRIEWRKVPTVLFSNELLDKAFSRAKASANRIDDSDRVFRVRKQMRGMVQTSGDIIAETLIETVHSWPSLDQMTLFDQALVDASVGIDEFRHHLGALQWAAKQVNSIASQNVKKITRTANIELMHEGRREAYGRISSIVDQVSENLEWLNETRLILQKLPSIDPMGPCIVVAGAPNVGKSAMISNLSSGVPEVASYPFTTKQLHVGHFEHRRLIYQLVDTPGLLDRPMEERNEIEMQAIAALEHIGSAVIFLIDRSETSGISIDIQMKLLEEVNILLPNQKIIVVESKADLLDPPAKQPDEEEGLWLSEQGNPAISATEGFGMEGLRSMLIEVVSEQVEKDPLKLPDGWFRSDIE